MAESGFALGQVFGGEVILRQALVRSEKEAARLLHLVLAQQRDALLHVQPGQRHRIDVAVLRLSGAIQELAAARVALQQAQVGTMR